MNYEKILQNIGLSKSEAIVYVSLLKLGSASHSELARKAKIKRPTLYKLLERLKEMNLISESFVGKRRILVAGDPHVYIENKHAELKNFEQIIPELNLLLNTASIKPRIKFYEGIKGIQKLYVDTLKDKGPILEFISLNEINVEMENYSKNFYIPERINRRIPIKILISGSGRTELINLKTAVHELREVKIIDKEGKKFPIPLDCYVFGNNVGFALFRKDSEPLGIIITSIEISTMMRSLFNFIWEARE